MSNPEEIKPASELDSKPDSAQEDFKKAFEDSTEGFTKEIGGMVHHFPDMAAYKRFLEDLNDPANK